MNKYTSKSVFKLQAKKITQRTKILKRKGSIRLLNDASEKGRTAASEKGRTASYDNIINIKKKINDTKGVNENKQITIYTKSMKTQMEH